MDSRAAHRFAAIIALAACSFADTVTLRGKPPFQEVRIEDFAEGILTFRGVSGYQIRRSLELVERFSIDGQDGLNEAERLASDNQLESAIDGYLTAEKAASQPWIGELIRARAIRACDQSGRIDRAVELLIRSGSSLMPRRCGAPGCSANRTAREFLDRAVRDDPARTGDFRRLWLELVIIDDEPMPPELGTEPTPSAAEAVAGPEVASTRPESALPPDPSDTPLVKASLPASGATPPTALPAENADGPASRPRTSGASIVAPRTTPRLPADSLVVATAVESCQTGEPGHAIRMLERGLRFVASDARPAWTMMLGQALVEGGSAQRAADVLTALTFDRRDATRRARALYFCGLANRRLNRTDRAKAQLREAIATNELPAELAAAADEVLRSMPD
ncbi:MAG: hypothetical protein U1D55_10155 [Phycisphaerae bacterium]